MDEMPSQEEQLIAEQYVMERELPRPDTDIKKAVMSVCLFIVLTALTAVLAMYVFKWLGIFELLPPGIAQFRCDHQAAFTALLFCVAYMISGICFARTAAIGAIKLYQHYAPEEIRRRCLFKPTCSEYAILAIRKYGLIIGLVKAYIRLFFKCRGNIYRIDYP